MYKKMTHGWLKHWDFILIDVISLQLSFLCAYVLRHAEVMFFNDILYRSEAMILFICQLLVILFGQTFKGVLRRGCYREFVSALKSAVEILLLTLVVLFIGKETGTYSRIVFVMTGVIYVVISYIFRLLLKVVLKKKFKSKVNSMLVVTTAEVVEEVLDKLEGKEYQQYFIKAVAVLDDKTRRETIHGYPLLKDDESTIAFTSREWVDEVLFVMPMGVETPKKIVETMTVMGITTHVSIFENEVSGGKQYIEKVGDYTVLTTSINMVSIPHSICKRAMDIAGGVVGCIITLILMLIVGPIIYIKSPGPIIFSQVRIGKNGKRFRIYKFRSMYLDAEERKKELMKHNKMDGLMFKMDYDPRIIGCEKIGKDGKPKGIGNFIRKTSIDEFPQFWNVLKGDMSLVGTRPPTVDEWEQYEPHHRARMAIKPGITGMWQVSGRSDITDFEEVVRLDTKYIEEWNLGLDIKIILKTVLGMLKSDGAV